MLTLKGKYNSANIFIDEIDQETTSQIYKMLNHPAFQNTYIAIMPDCHAGKGSVIGFTMKMNNYIIPNVVGVDGACGMLSYRFKKKELDLQSIDEWLKVKIPTGYNIYSNDIVVDRLSSSFKEELQEWCKKIDFNYQKALRSVASLGAGNHFCEIGEDEEGYLWATIHSGSRGFGKAIADYYQQKAKQNLIDNFLGNEPGFKGLEWLIVNSPIGKEYLNAMEFVRKYAQTNRVQMMEWIVQRLGDPVHKIESLHNYIGEDGIIRKGATPAYEGQEIILPFTMKDGLIIGVGKGSKKYNFSAPHGAGRILSRSKAKETLDVDTFIKEMKNAGVYTTTANESTLDEAPAAYKDKQVILDNIKETMDILHFVKPLYNLKASS